MKKKHFHFFAYLSRMKYINRWGLMRNTRQENIQEHSHQVAVIAHALAVVAAQNFGKKVDPNKVGMMGIYHDAHEIMTGDLPTPVKYFNNELKSAYKKIEEMACDKLLSMIPENMKNIYSDLLIETESYEWQLVKAADKIAALIKCLEEERMGNSEFKKAKETILESIKSIEMDEVKYFMDNFITEYSLSIDDLK